MLPSVLFATSADVCTSQFFSKKKSVARRFHIMVSFFFFFFYICYIVKTLLRPQNRLSFFFWGGFKSVHCGFFFILTLSHIESSCQPDRSFFFSGRWVVLFFTWLRLYVPVSPPFFFFFFHKLSLFFFFSSPYLSDACWVSTYSLSLNGKKKKRLSATRTQVLVAPLSNAYFLTPYVCCS